MKDRIEGSIMLGRDPGPEDGSRVPRTEDGVSENKTMTVAELIDLLKQAPPDSLVEADGCDCVDGAIGIEIRDHGYTLTRSPTVVIARSDGVAFREVGREGFVVPDRLRT